jgi:nucleoside-diphosphate-sugar epimerase
VSILNILVTGGAGFIGRWVVKKLLSDNHNVWVLDDLSNGREENIKEFKNYPNFKAFIKGDIKDNDILEKLFNNKFEICYHLGASINVQDSIDDPKTTFDNDVIGTFNVLELCRKNNTKMVFMSTCMVYDRANDETGITELHPTKPASPYAGSKIAGENMVLSYWYAYKLPTVVVRPFNTYGPFQKTGGEGGVIAIFLKKALNGEELFIYGTGEQTRDFLYVEDCAEFVVQAGYSNKANGEIINAGSGRDISINDLALLIAEDEKRIKHVPHIHPQSEIMKLLCNYNKANRLLGWKPNHSLEAGIAKTKSWIEENSHLI